MALKDEALFAELKEKYDKIEYRLYAAGEIMCMSENTLIFNFYSGTYKMKQHISDKRATYEEAFVTHMMHDFSPKYTNIHFNYCPFITNDAVPLTKKSWLDYEDIIFPYFYLIHQINATVCGMPYFVTNFQTKIIHMRRRHVTNCNKCTSA